MKYITHKNLGKLLEVLKEEYEVYVPVKRGQQRCYERFQYPSSDILIGEVRPFEPLKAFYTRAREVVAEDFNADVPHADEKPFAIVGVKACDLKGFTVQDFVFTNHDYQDPFYIKNRQNNLVISADCTCTIETCFCLALGIKPYPEKNFDINLSQIQEGFVVESGSEKGSRLMEKYTSLFKEANDTFVQERDAQRESVKRAVGDNIADNEVPNQDAYKGIIEKNLESDIWRDEAKTCVECGACNIICPTCHCFLLYDQKNENNMKRLRLWDSCMVKDFARVAGGANPRPHLWMRLRNRFEKKFDFFKKVADVYACTGCGRCISACPAKIDIRKVLKRLVNNA
ncbi:MAG: 4Fe-4S dicluster domain-containing protein [bacterium]